MLQPSGGLPNAATRPDGQRGHPVHRRPQPFDDLLTLYIENGMVPVPAIQRHKRGNLPNPGGKWRWDNDEGWISPEYEFIKADLLFDDKMRRFVTEHRKNRPEQPFFAVLSTQICHAPVPPAPEFRGATRAGPRGDFVHELDILVGRVLDLVAALEVLFRRSCCV